MKIHVVSIVALVFTLVTPLARADGLKSACEQMLTGPYQDYSAAEQFKIFGVVVPQSVDELVSLVKTTNRPIAVKGAGFSMGGQTASSDGIVVDMKNLNQVITYDRAKKTLRVGAGATWRQIQHLIDPDDLSVMIMQSYNNFQVGGSLSVNAHGRYNGYGPLIASVLDVRVLLADGSIVTASRDLNPDLFAGVIGGYAALGIILEANLQLVDNTRLERRIERFKNEDIAVAVRQAIDLFERKVENTPATVMFNADIYPKAYDIVDVITFSETDRPVTKNVRIQPAAAEGLWANVWRSILVSFEQMTTWGKRVRFGTIKTGDAVPRQVVTRNYEASYDNAHLRPLSDRVGWMKKLWFAKRKALLQEYFVPREQLPEFIAKMKNILLENEVNVSNVSIRHVPANTESTLSWSAVDSFAVVIYYTQHYGDNSDARLARARDWTRQMIAEVEKTGGSFYLPYQVYATRDQFNHAYPKHQEFFALKAKYDPQTRFNNSLWDQYRLSDDTYYYRNMLTSDAGRDELNAYFSNIFSINDPARFTTAIDEALRVARKKGRDVNDRNVYDELLRILPTYANGTFKRTVETLKALRVQQREMARQTAVALADQNVTKVNGYVEIGSPGRYVWPLKKLIKMSGPTYVVNDSFSVANWIETSFGFKVPAVATSKRLKFSDYDQFQQSEIPDASVDLASMYIGLHHCPPEKLPAFVASINRILRVGGRFVLRDHDADERVLRMAFLAHSTYNAGLGLPYGAELGEIRNLHPLTYWKGMMERAGFRHVGQDQTQEGDPTGNTLMTFEKIDRTPAVDDAIHQSIAAEGPGLNLNLLPGYARAQSNTYMTQAEWFLVDIFNELSRYTKESPWYTFPFDRFTSLYERVYTSVRDFARREGPRDQKAFAQYDAMDRQLLSGIKMMFGAMKIGAGWAARSAGGVDAAEVVRGQRVLSDFFGQYAEFMTHTPWYKFPHRKTLSDLEARANAGNAARPIKTTRLMLRQARMPLVFGDGLRRGLGSPQPERGGRGPDHQFPPRSRRRPAVATDRRRKPGVAPADRHVLRGHHRTLHALHAGHESHGRHGRKGRQRRRKLARFGAGQGHWGRDRTADGAARRGADVPVPDRGQTGRRRLDSPGVASRSVRSPQIPQRGWGRGRRGGPGSRLLAK